MRGPSPIFFLVRHGAVSRSLSDRWWGRLEVPLAQDAGPALTQTATLLRANHPGRLVSSPAQRAVTSARIVQRTLKLPVEVMPALAEVDLGLFAGHSMVECADLYPAAWNAYLADTVDGSPPGGESFRHLADRVVSWAYDWPRDQDVVVVTHTGVILALACTAMGLPFRERIRLAQPPPGSLTVLSLRPPVLHSFADAAFPPQDS